MWNLRRLAGLAVVAAISAGCSDDPTTSAPASLEVSFELADGSQVDEVSYSVTGNGIVAIEGVIDTSAPGATASVEIFGIPPGQQYLVSLSATTTDGELTCEGASRFDVSVGVVTQVHVMLGCERAPRFGAVRANGELNVCADLIKVVASPLQTSIANGLTLASQASDEEGDPVAYRWTATGGTLTNPDAAVTTYTCGVEGAQTVQIEVSDDGFDHCVDEWTIDVTCVVTGNGEVEATPAFVDSDPGEGDRVVPGVWLKLSFADTVADGAFEGFSLRCNGEERPTTVHRLGDAGRELVLNPLKDLPNDASCTLGWLGPDGPASLAFDTSPPLANPTVPYDRTDESRSVPFPDDVWIVPDSASPTGRRLEVAVPDREVDIVRVLINLKIAVGTTDGFSPLGPFVVELSEAPDPNSLPTTPTLSLDPLATVGLFDVDPGSPSYGVRIPFELYVRSVSTPADPVKQHALVLFPSIPLTPRGQYALVVTKRALADPDRAFAPSAFMTAVLGGPVSSEAGPVTSAREILDPVLAGLSAAMPPLFADDVALVTRFTVRSTDRFPLTPLAMREQIHQLPPPTFVIDRVRPGSGDVEAIVEGTWEAPEWREGTKIVRDDEGLPVLVGTRQVPFILAIPRAAAEAPVPVTMYQHGNPGSAEAEVPSQARRYLAEGGHAVIGFTDNANREIGSDTLAQRAAILGPLLISGELPDFDMQTTGEQLAFLRFIQQLGDLDVVPFGNPDGEPDLDLGRPLTYDGISSGANRGQAFVPYAPEVVAAALVVGGGRAGEILFYQDIIGPGGLGSPLLNAVSLFAPSIRPIDAWFGIALYQLALDPQDQHNHASFMYANPVEVGGTFKKPSVLVQEGIGDTFVPNNATRSLVYALGATPLVGPIAQPVPYLMQAETPLVANVDAQTTSAYAQYVPNGSPGLSTTPGCENWFEGHFCAQVARVSLDQRFLFFKTALEETAPTVDSGPIDFCPPEVDCDDGNPCTQDRCEPRTGNCSSTPSDGLACEVDGAPGFCSSAECVTVELCSMIDPSLRTSMGTLSCTVFGIEMGLSATLGARPLTPVAPGPVEYAIQTAVALQGATIDLLNSLSASGDVLLFESVIESTLGSEQPAPLIGTQPSEPCLLVFQGTSIVGGLASEPATGTWILKDDATAQQVTLQDVTFAFSIAGLDLTFTTTGPEANCAWDVAPPSLTEMP